MSFDGRTDSILNAFLSILIVRVSEPAEGRRAKNAAERASRSVSLSAQQKNPCFQIWVLTWCGSFIPLKSNHDNLEVVLVNLKDELSLRSPKEGNSLGTRKYFQPYQVSNMSDAWLPSSYASKDPLSLSARSFSFRCRVGIPKIRPIRC